VKVGAIVAANARCWPEREALVCGGARLTFRELDAASDRMANALLARGLRPGDRVVLYLGNRVEFVTLLLAVMKAGGLVVPVATRLVGPELAYIVGDAQPFALAFEPAGRGAAAGGRRPLGALGLLQDMGEGGPLRALRALLRLLGGVGAAGAAARLDGAQVRHGRASRARGGGFPPGAAESYRLPGGAATRAPRPGALGPKRKQGVCRAGGVGAIYLKMRALQASPRAASGGPTPPRGEKFSPRGGRFRRGGRRPGLPPLVAFW